jgi:hypothetical protein
MARYADGIEFVADAPSGRFHAVLVTSLFHFDSLRRPWAAFFPRAPAAPR